MRRCSVCRKSCTGKARIIKRIPSACSSQGFMGVQGVAVIKQIMRAFIYGRNALFRHMATCQQRIWKQGHELTVLPLQSCAHISPEQYCPHCNARWTCQHTSTCVAHNRAAMICSNVHVCFCVAGYGQPIACNAHSCPLQEFLRKSVQFTIL